MGGPGEERVHRLTLCPNPDAICSSITVRGCEHSFRFWRFSCFPQAEGEVEVQAIEP